MDKSIAEDDRKWLAGIFEQIKRASTSAEFNYSDLDLNDFDGYIDEINILTGRIIRKLYELRRCAEHESGKNESE